jgi:hypothetical protein
MPATRLLVGLPTYDGTRHNAMAIVDLTLDCAAAQIQVLLDPYRAGSLLAMNFNALWCDMLNLREEGRVTHFLLLHADVVPETPQWLPRLLAEMQRVGADALSVIIPIKTEAGYTSTARDTDPWRPQRYTMHEIMAKPETWTAPDLLANTGCLLVDVREPWVEGICFTIRDKIHRGPDGKWIQQTQPEDWDFSRQVRARGRSLWVTRTVAVRHMGNYPYPNDRAWGTESHDALNVEWAQATRAQHLREAEAPAAV